MKELLLASLPILGSIGVTSFGYVQAKKVAAANAEAKAKEAAAENRRIDQEGLDRLNDALAKEIERVKAEKVSSDRRHYEEISSMQGRMDKMQSSCDRTKREMRALDDWARTMVGILNHPWVAQAVESAHLTIPSPPTISDEAW